MTCVCTYLNLYVHSCSPTSQEELQRVNRDERPSIATALAERKIDSAAAANNNNKVKSMATQLLAKFEENAPTQSTGLKRQVGWSCCLKWLWKLFKHLWIHKITSRAVEIKFEFWIFADYISNKTTHSNAKKGAFEFQACVRQLYQWCTRWDDDVRAIAFECFFFFFSLSGWGHLMWRWWVFHSKHWRNREAECGDLYVNTATKPFTQNTSSALFFVPVFYVNKR